MDYALMGKKVPRPEGITINDITHYKLPKLNPIQFNSNWVDMDKCKPNWDFIVKDKSTNKILVFKNNIPGTPGGNNWGKAKFRKYPVDTEKKIKTPPSYSINDIVSYK